MSKSRTCCFCGRSHPVANCKIVELTPAEEAGLIANGMTPESEYAYCLPCWRILSDPSSAPGLMRGTLERELLKLGVSVKRAKAISDRYHTRLIELQRHSKHSTQS